MIDRPTVLFVCVHNAGRSQMAAGWLAHLAGDRVEIRSAGSEPAEHINPVAVAAMAEVGIDLTGGGPKKLNRDDVSHADVVITMGCGDACPVFPGKRYEDWQLTDPAGQPIAVVRQIRDEIRTRVQGLIDSLDLPPQPRSSPGDSTAALQGMPQVLSVDAPATLDQGRDHAQRCVDHWNLPCPSR